MDFGMFKESFPLLLTGLATLGGAIAWVFKRMDDKNQKEREFEQVERDKLERLFSEQIKALQDEVHSQNQEIIQLRRELNIYVRHVGVLEGLLHANSIEFPRLSLAAS